jgi:hypothetical protein
MSLGFIVSFKLLDILCRETVLPVVLVGLELYTAWGNANLRAMDAKNISKQMKRFWYPAETVPIPAVSDPSFE